MPHYYEEEEVEKKKPQLACHGVRDDLKACLLKSDCVVKVVKR